LVTMYVWHKIKVLKANGAGIKKIAKELKLSRNTVRKYLRSPDPPEFKKREYRKGLEKYEGHILEMLEKKFIGTRIYNELKKEGYGGSLSSVHRYIRDLKKENEIKSRITTRVETQPGQQMQYDWKPWDLPVGNRIQKIYIHEAVLCYSRKKHYSFSLKISTQDVIRAIEEALRYFSGVPTELVIDNARQMVITHTREGVVYYNEEFLKFCGLYGIQPSACQNYRARTKGKVERPFYYIQEHLLRGLEVKNLEEFETKLRAFQDDYNKRQHSRLKAAPDELFEQEKEYLKSFVPADPAHLFSRELRKVSSDGYISYDGVFYPVPMHLCLKNVWVEAVYGRKLKIYDEAGTQVLEQEICPWNKGKTIPHPEHEEINGVYRKKKEQFRSHLVARFEASFGEAGRIFCNGLKNKTGANLYWHLREILHYQELYGQQALASAIAECISLGAYHKNSVKRFLEGKKLKAPLLESAQIPANLERANIKRDLSFYAIAGEEACSDD